MGGLEPPAFRLTAERANQLRHKSYDDHLFSEINKMYLQTILDFIFESKQCTYKMKNKRNM